jgi:hypothetical protein
MNDSKPQEGFQIVLVIFPGPEEGFPGKWDWQALLECEGGTWLQDVKKVRVTDPENYHVEVIDD